MAAKVWIYVCQLIGNCWSWVLKATDFAATIVRSLGYLANLDTDLDTIIVLVNEAQRTSMAIRSPR